MNENMETETFYHLGTKNITESEIIEQANKILDFLKEKRQTHAVNKFVLDKAKELLDNDIFKGFE